MATVKPVILAEERPMELDLTIPGVDNDSESESEQAIYDPCARYMDGRDEENRPTQSTGMMQRGTLDGRLDER